MKELCASEVAMVSGGAGVSGETIGCAIGGAIGSRAGVVGGAVGCIAGGYIANNASSWGAAFGSAINSSGAFRHSYFQIM